jgi:pilus assembly protein CpaC
VRTLAEPNLTVVSGEAGHFLAGGSFPVPSGEDITGRISVTFKEFGVGLGFTPVVLSNGRISLKISTEYSQLTNVGALTQGSTTTTNTTGTGTTTTPSYTIPGLTIRRAETVVELPSGGAMMIAGLLEQTHAEDLSSLPGLMQLPILGALFRSRDFQQNETELVVIVTPYLVKSLRPDQIQTPADGLQVADDISSTLMGQLNKGFNKPAPPPGKTYQGPFGYVVE